MTALWWGLTAGACAAFVALVLAVGARATWVPVERARWKLPLLLGGALLVRLGLAASTQGYPPDVNTFSAWAAHAAEGLTAFYSPGYFADYPPGYIYVLWAIGKLRLAWDLDFGSPGFRVLLNLPASLADLGAVWVLHRLALRVWSADTAVGLATLYAFNPAVLLNSAVWGQVDAVLTLFLLLGILLLPKRPAWSGAAFAAALLIKPQALIFAPLPLLWFAERLLRRRDRATAADLLVFAGAGLFVFCLGALPFGVREEIGWIVGKYAGTLASYPYATLNAFNLFALTGGNLADVGDSPLLLPYSTWGTIFLVATVLFSALVAFRGRGGPRLWYLALFLSASVFVLSAKMHERYLFPALAPALALFAATRDARALVLFAGFTVTLFLNTAEVLALGLRDIYAVPRWDPLLVAVSAGNVLLWALLVKVGYDRYVSGKAAAPGRLAQPDLE